MDWPGAPPALSAGWELVPPLKTLPTCSPRSTDKTFANSSRHVSPSVLVTQDSAKNRPYRARRVMISLQVYAQSGLWQSNAERPSGPGDESKIPQSQSTPTPAALTLQSRSRPLQSPSILASMILLRLRSAMLAGGPSLVLGGGGALALAGGCWWVRIDFV